MKRFSRRHPGERRGVAVVLVIALVSLAMAVSYVVIRVQSTQQQIQHNSGRRDLARQAAITGLTLALERMHDAQWQGVDSTLKGRVSEHESYAVAFQTGDRSLTADDEDYRLYPYRVTLVSTGTSVDPANPQITATHRASAVVQFVPRALGEVPAAWDEVQNYTVYQWRTNSGRDFRVELPASIRGPVRIQAEAELFSMYPEVEEVRLRYLSDLNAMRLAGHADLRPFADDVHLPYSSVDAKQTTRLAALGVNTLDLDANLGADWAMPSEAPSYRLYPGGKLYYGEPLDAELTNATLEPDPAENPLGIFYRATDLDLKDNVSVRGTLLLTEAYGGDVYIDGHNVSLQGAELLPLDGSDEPVQLPVVMAADDLRVIEGAQGTLSGMAVTGDDFDVRPDVQGGIVFRVEGRIVSRDFKIQQRSEWVQTATWWWEAYTEFLADLELSLDLGELVAPRYFPQWLAEKRALSPVPTIDIVPPEKPVRYHWFDGQNPIYAPHPDDDGLRWDVVEWNDDAA